MGDGSFKSNKVTLQDANVNSGTAVNILANSISIKTEVFANAPDVAFSDLTATYANRLPEGRYSGFGTPKITLRGVYHVGEDSSNYLTKALLKSFISSSAIKTLVSDNTGTISVLITNVSEDYAVTDNTNGVTNLSISFVQVKTV